MQLIDTSQIQDQTERIRLAQRFFAPDATAEEKRLANRAIAQLLQDCQPTIRYFQRQFSSLDPAAAYSAILDAFHFAIRTYQEGVSQFKTWLSTKVRFKLLDLCRGKKIDLVDLTALVANGFDIFTSTPALESEELVRLREAIALLPEPTQRIIALFSQGYSWAEVGETIGKAADAARMTYNRAVQKLRKQFIAELPIETEDAQEIPAVPTPLHWMAALKLRGCRVRFASQGADRPKVVVSTGRTHDLNESATHSISSPTMAQKPNAHERDRPGRHRRDARLSRLIGGSIHAALVCSGGLCVSHGRQVLEQNA